MAVFVPYIFRGLCVSAAVVAVAVGANSDSAGAHGKGAAATRSQRLVFSYQASLAGGPPFRVHVQIVNADGSGRRALTKGEVDDGDVSAAPNGRWIGFERDLGGIPFVFVIKPDGSGLKQLLPRNRESLIGRRPWTPDGNAILVKAPVQGGWRLFLVDPETGKARRLAGKWKPWDEPVWSPDGRRFALLRGPYRDGHAIEVVDVVSGRAIRVASGLGYLAEPSWLRDGKRVAFGADDGVWIVNASGGGERRLTEGGLHMQDSPPEASPTADKILFTTFPVDGSLQIEIVNTNGSGRRVLFRQPAPEGTESEQKRGHCCLAPTWSPDGRKIAFIRNRAGPRRDELWVMNSDGTAKKRLTSRGYVGRPSWLPARNGRIRGAPSSIPP